MEDFKYYSSYIKLQKMVTFSRQMHIYVPQKKQEELNIVLKLFKKDPRVTSKGPSKSTVLSAGVWFLLDMYYNKEKDSILKNEPTEIENQEED